MILQAPQDNTVRALGNVVVLVLYVCVWSSACDSAVAWLDTISSDGNEITASMIASKVLTVLTLTWAWVLLVFVCLYLLQYYILNAMRADSNQSKYGHVTSICFSMLTRWNVLTAFLASTMSTFIFAWVTSKRALVQTGKASAEHRRQAVSDSVKQAMVFNLIVVVLSVSLTSY